MNPCPSQMPAPAASSLWTPILRQHDNPAVRLLCFPYAGAGPVVFRPWVQALPAGAELRVAQLPGRSVRLREPHITQMRCLIDALEPVLAPLFDRPVVLFGHSLGSLVAFEVARRFQARGTPPAHLFVAANVAPQFPDPNPRIHQLPPDQFLSELRALNGMPPAVLACAELLEIMLPVVRSDFTLLETYEYESGPPLSCPLTIFGGTADPRTNHAGLAAWREQTSAVFEQVTVPGDHFFLDSARSQVLEVICRALAARRLAT